MCSSDLPGFDEDKQPDAKWLLTCLSTFTPDDDIFKKSYVPPVKESKLSQIEAIELPSSFLKDLPLTKRKVKRRSLHMFGEGLQKQKLSAMKERYRALGLKVIVVQADHEEKEEAKQKE